MYHSVLSESTCTLFCTSCTQQQRQAQIVCGNIGTISAAELGYAMRFLGHNPSEAQLQQMLRERDLDGNGTITWQEFLAIAQQQLPQVWSLVSCWGVFGMSIGRCGPLVNIGELLDTHLQFTSRRAALLYIFGAISGEHVHQRVLCLHVPSEIAALL